jgi:hypothetical protein
MNMPDAAKMLNAKKFIKKTMDTRLPKEQSDGLWKKAEERLRKILGTYPDIPEKERLHPYNYIFPTAAIYLTLKDEIGAPQAYDIIESTISQMTEDVGRQLANMIHFPGFRSLFLWAWGPVSKNMFGPSRGFRNVFYPKKKGEMRMDILACPYCKWFGELGCFELTKIYCDNDERTYGHLPGLKFQRTQTLGKNGEKCDFLIRKE